MDLDFSKPLSRRFVRLNQTNRNAFICLLLFLIVEYRRSFNPQPVGPLTETLGLLRESLPVSSADEERIYATLISVEDLYPGEDDKPEWEYDPWLCSSVLGLLEVLLPGSHGDETSFRSLFGGFMDTFYFHSTHRQGLEGIMTDQKCVMAVTHPSYVGVLLLFFDIADRLERLPITNDCRARRILEMARKTYPGIRRPGRA